MNELLFFHFCLLEKHSNLKTEESPEKKPAIPLDVVLLSMPCFLSVSVHAAGLGVELSIARPALRAWWRAAQATPSGAWDEARHGHFFSLYRALGIGREGWQVDLPGRLHLKVHLRIPPLPRLNDLGIVQLDAPGCKAVRWWNGTQPRSHAAKHASTSSSDMHCCLASGSGSGSGSAGGNDVSSGAAAFGLSTVTSVLERDALFWAPAFALSSDICGGGGVAIAHRTEPARGTRSNGACRVSVAAPLPRDDCQLSPR